MLAFLDNLIFIVFKKLKIINFYLTKISNLFIKSINSLKMCILTDK